MTKNSIQLYKCTNWRT